MRISKTQLRIGTRIEMEHTKSRKVARRIATDHLKEFQGAPYYTYLNKMEAKLRKIAKKSRK
jgi:hypothetical protein